jgi:hypothetical protein
MVQAGVPDPEVLTAWLTELHYEEYFHLFRAAGYDMPTISRMTPEAEMSDIYRHISMVINIGRYLAYRGIAIALPSVKNNGYCIAIALTVL